MTLRNETVFARGYFGLFGADLILDEQLHVWLIEINSTPGLLRNSALRKRVSLRFASDLLRAQLDLVKWEERQRPPLGARDHLTAAALPGLSAFEPLVCEHGHAGGMEIFPFERGLPARCQTQQQPP